MSPLSFSNKGHNMITKIDLCSMALLKLGEKSIQSLVDDTPSNRYLAVFASVALCV